jgi:hypothetical protein
MKGRGVYGSQHVTGEVYLRILRQELPALARQLPDGGPIYFMQNGAGIHRWGPVTRQLQELEANGGIAGHPLIWIR